VLRDWTRVFWSFASSVIFGLVKSEGVDWIPYGETTQAPIITIKKAWDSFQERETSMDKECPDAWRGKKPQEEIPSGEDADKIRINMPLRKWIVLAKQFRILKGTSYDSSGHEITTFDYIKAREAKWEVIIAGCKHGNVISSTVQMTSKWQMAEKLDQRDSNF